MISLVTATLGRTKELDRLCLSLANQIYKDFEFILVDQNEDGAIDYIVRKYGNSFRIIHIKSSIKGLSYNRNIGLRYCHGEIVGFPDDDCYYDDKVLLQVANQFCSASKYSFVVTEVRAIETKKIFIRTPHRPIKRRSIFQYCISYNFFVHRNPDLLFDEKMGVGQYWGSGEETDYLWALLQDNDMGIFLQNTYIFHPQNAASINYKRAYSYGLGFGALFKKEIIYRKHWGYFSLYLYNIIRTLGGCLVKRQKKFYYYTLLGRIKGFISYK